MLDGLPDRAAERVVESILDGLARANLEWLQYYPATPMLYASGVQYVDSDTWTLDEWRDIPTLLSLGHGNCSDLVPWRVAELQRSGYREARSIAHIQHLSDNQTLFHAYVRVAGNQTEDPSERLKRYG